MSMIIAIDGSRAFLKRRTGIEEYSYQVIKHLRTELSDARVVLYIRADQGVDFDLPANWCVKKLWAPRFWTQIRLSFEMLVNRPDTLFVPAHTVPLIHPVNTAVVIHGLEYEFCPKAYSLWGRLSMRMAIKFSCRVAKHVICVSENTKKDVMRLYGTPEEKITVIYEGYENSLASGSEKKSEFLPSNQETRAVSVLGQQDSDFFSDPDGKSFDLSITPYFLFIGRLEERKNVVRFIEAFEMLKEKYALPHVLVLAGKPGYGYDSVQAKIVASAYKKDIIELGYISEEEKWRLLKHAEGFLFATLYEGFGIPVLEAQSVGVPVITSDNSSLPEVAGEGALLVDPENTEAIMEAMHSLVSDNGLKSDILKKASENVRRFSWVQCAKEIGSLLMR